MRKWMNTYFDFSKREFNGLITLVVLIFMVSMLPYSHKLIIPESVNSYEEQVAIKQLMLPANEAAMLTKKRLRSGVKNDLKHALFYFDPNTIDIEEWQKLGLSFKQSASIIKYIAKGGRFRKVGDLKKMYTISFGMYKRLEPYVRIDDDEKQNAAKPKGSLDGKAVYVASKVKIIEINGADSIGLIEIKGIGASFARRIIKYRDRVGGFYKKEQLLEVFGLDSAKYLEIKDQVSINTEHLRKININTAKAEDFKGHPYIRYKQINAIIEYRKQHGNYSNIADLNKIAILNPEIMEHLAPYLTF